MKQSLCHAKSKINTLLPSGSAGKRTESLLKWFRKRSETFYKRLDPFHKRLDTFHKRSESLLKLSESLYKRLECFTKVSEKNFTNKFSALSLRMCANK